MRSMIRAVASFVCLLGGVSTALGQNISDSTGPEILSLSFGRSAIDTSSGDPDVSVTLHITDDLSGVNYGYVYLQTQAASQPNNTRSITCFVGQLASGSRIDGMFTGTCQFPHYAQSGTWYVYNLYTYDMVGNYRAYNNSGSALPSFPATVAVTSPDRPVSTTPQLAEPPIVSPSSVDVSSAAQTVSVTVHVVSQSRFAYGYAYLYDPTSTQSVAVSFSRLSGTATDGVYLGTTTIPRYSRSGTWRLQYLYLFDESNNSTYYYWLPSGKQVYFNNIFQQSATAPNAATLGVTSTPSDTTAPSLVYFNVAPSSIDVSTSSAYISYTLSGTDELAGFSSASFGFVSPNGQQYRSGYATPTTSTGDIYFPQFSEAGNWRLSYMYLYDNNGNYRYLDANAVAALGFPANIQISSGLTVSDVSVRTGNPATLTARLTYHGAPSADETIAFAVQGHSVGSARTDANGVATLTGVSVSGIAVGTYPNAITASFAGHGAQAATSGAATLVVTNKLDQAITFGAIADHLLSDSPITVSATASSGLAVTFAAIGACTVSGTSVTLTGAGTCQIVASQAGNATYNAAPAVSQSFTIRAKQDQTITFATIADRRYGDAAMTLSASASSGLVVSFAPIGHCAIINGKLVLGTAGSCSITASQGGNGSYKPAPTVTRSFTIAPAPLTITASNQAKRYGAAMPEFSASYAGFVNGDVPGELSGTLTFTTAATAASHAGAFDVTPSGLSSGNYAITYSPGTLTVTPATLTIRADNQTKVYGAALPALTVSYSGWVNGDTVASLTKAAAIATDATAASHVGTYAITATGAEVADYAITYTSGTLTVTAATLTIRADNQTKVYGAALPALTVSYSGWVNGDTAASLTKAAAITTDATAASHVGTYAITASGAEVADYAITYAPGTLTVTAATLTIRADNQTKVYGAALPALTVNYSGWVNGDTAASLTKAAAITSDATTASHVGTYAIAVSGAEAADYVISYTPGTLTVTAATLTIRADNQTKVYGAALPALTVSHSGWVNGDTTASLTKAAAITTDATAASHVGTYAITATGAEVADYAITYAPGTLTVTAATLTIRADNQTKVYGAALPALTASYSGWVNGDTTASLTRAAAITTDATAASHVGTYAIAASGAEAPDYAITYAPGTLTVTPAPLTITANDQTKVYGAALPVLTVSYSGWVNGDSAANLTKAPSIVTTAVAASVGTYPITVSGAVSSDYGITYVPGSLTVTYNTCLLYDPAKIVNSGATIPIKLQLCSASGSNASAQGIVLTAVDLVLDSTNTSGVVEDSGNANPDGNFRFEPGLAGYIFNLSTKGLGRGTYSLVLSATGDPAPHRLQFQVR